MNVTEALEQVARLRIAFMEARISHANAMADYNSAVETIGTIECLINVHETAGVKYEAEGSLDPANLSRWQNRVSSLEGEIAAISKEMALASSRLAVAEMALRMVLKG